MESATPVQERQHANALPVVVSCASRTRKRVARVARFSARPAVSYIERSIRSLCVGNVESEKGLKTSRTAASDVQGFFQSVRS